MPAHTTTPATRPAGHLIACRLLTAVLLLFGLNGAQADTLLLRDGLVIHPPAPALHHGFPYWSTSDTTLRPDKPFADFGGTPTLRLEPGADRILVRFEHILTAIGGPWQTLDGATLTLIVDQRPDKLPDPADIRVYRVLESWNEGGRDDSENYWAATWRARYHSRRTNIIAWHGAGASQPDDAEIIDDARIEFAPVKLKVYETDPDTGREYAFEKEMLALRISGLHDAVRHFMDRRYENHGWLIRWDDADAPADATLTFHSREASADLRECRPALTIAHSAADRPAYDIDLGIAYIMRYPEYYAWLDTGRDGEHGGYERKTFRGQPGNGVLKKPAFWDTPKNPQPGDTVWYVARIKNHGPEPLPHGFRYEWRLNDRLVEADVYDRPLPPQFETEIYVAMPFPDRLEDHRDEFLTLRVEPHTPDGQPTPPENKNNNERTIFTKGRATGVVADETARKFYLAHDNTYGTRSFEDWIQFQIDYWNEVYMAKSRFRNVFPDGAMTRIRVQRVEFVRNGILAGGVHIPFDLRQPKYDGMWGWDFTQAREKPELLDDETWFHRQTLKMVEPSLIHEMSHQCFGLIDIYWMNMEPARDAEKGTGGKVRVRDPENPGKFLTTVGYFSADGGLMGGGDTRYTPQHEGTSLYSSHSVGGLNTNAPYRGGFFGDYLYDVPEHVTLEVRTADGQPAADADVRILQSTYGWDPPKQPIDELAEGGDLYFEGQLDDSGRVKLPNQETLEDGPFTTLTGHTLRPNIFGRIHVVAFNGNMLIRVKHEGQYYYHFLTLWELNVAYWMGNTHHYVYSISLTPDKRPGPGFKVPRHPIVLH